VQGCHCWLLVEVSPALGEQCPAAAPFAFSFSLDGLVRIPSSLLPHTLLLGGALVPLTAPSAQAPVDSAGVAAVVERFHHALAEGDSAAALGLLAEDAADIAFVRAVEGTRSPVRVNVRGDVAWTTATSRTRGNYRGRAVNSGSADLMVLTRVPDGWKISAIHWSSRDLP
jgi:hypothetical protein